MWGSDNSPLCHNKFSYRSILKECFFQSQSLFDKYQLVRGAAAAPERACEDEYVLRPSRMSPRMGSQGKQKPKESAQTSVNGMVQNLLTSATCARKARGELLSNPQSTL